MLPGPELTDQFGVTVCELPSLKRADAVNCSRTVLVYRIWPIDGKRREYRCYMRDFNVIVQLLKPAIIRGNSSRCINAHTLCAQQT